MAKSNKSTGEAATPWRNRITRQGMAPVGSIRAHPLNFRDHPELQQEAMTGVLEEIGLVQDIIINERTGKLLDGHLRVELARRAGIKELPAKWVDLSEEEERIVLATFDPIGALAVNVADRIQRIQAQTNVERPAIADLISRTAANARALLETASVPAVTAPPTLTVQTGQEYDPATADASTPSDGVEDDEEGGDYFDASKLPDAPQTQTASLEAGRSYILYLTFRTEAEFQEGMRLLTFGQRDLQVPGQRYAQVDASELLPQWQELLGA